MLLCVPIHGSRVMTNICFAFILFSFNICCDGGDVGDSLIKLCLLVLFRMCFDNK